MNKKTLVYVNNIVLWMLVIFYYFIIISFSATPAVKSKAESQTVVNIVEKVSSVFFDKIEGDEKLWISEKNLHTLVRKTAHIVNFFILAFLHSMLFFSNSRQRRLAVLITLVMGFCGAVLDEITQLFVEGRSAQLSDVFVDFSGTIMGCILFGFLYKLYISKLKRG